MGGEMQKVETIQELLSVAAAEDLYTKLVLQLNKDLAYANVELSFEEKTTPEDLKGQLHEMVYRLVNDRFADYLNLLYIIDVSEDKVRQLDGSDLVRLSEQVTFLILKREWQKVWYKNRY
ncbi:hypothetical protein [Robertkochia flava]|uniref:hypothetical protein n=1 Tax=Robertkochia flava TaxID=3447986 RepID=UPI001CCF0DE0|nr:hypothetical protein [Robertkochia marina]